MGDGGYIYIYLVNVGRQGIHCLLAVKNGVGKGFSVFGDSFDNCLTNLEKVLSSCEEKNIVLN